MTRFSVSQIQDARKFRKNAPTVHFRALCAEAKRIGLPLFFRRDLYRWDRRSLMRTDPALPFAWCVYENGTHLVRPHLDGKYHGADLVKMIDQTFLCPRKRWYWWNGARLAPMDPSEIQDRMRETRCAA